MLTALLAGSAVAYREWRARRDQEDRRERALRQATMDVTFIDTWLSAHAKLPGGERQKQTARALADLDRAYEVMSAQVRAEQAQPRRRNTLDRLRTLLLIPLHRPGAKVLRVLYYLLFFMALLMVIGSNSYILNNLDQDLAVSIIAAMITTVVWFIPAALCYFFAKLADRLKRPTTYPSPPPPEPPYYQPPDPWRGSEASQYRGPYSSAP